MQDTGQEQVEIQIPKSLAEHRQRESEAMRFRHDDEKNLRELDNQVEFLTDTRQGIISDLEKLFHYNEFIGKDLPALDRAFASENKEYSTAAAEITLKLSRMTEIPEAKANAHSIAERNARHLEKLAESPDLRSSITALLLLAETAFEYEATRDPRKAAKNALGHTIDHISDVLEGKGFDPDTAYPGYDDDIVTALEPLIELSPHLRGQAEAIYKNWLEKRREEAQKNKTFFPFERKLVRLRVNPGRPHLVKFGEELTSEVFKGYGLDYWTVVGEWMDGIVAKQKAENRPYEENFNDVFLENFGLLRRLEQGNPGAAKKLARIGIYDYRQHPFHTLLGLVNSETKEKHHTEHASVS